MYLCVGYIHMFITVVDMALNHVLLHSLYLWFRFQCKNVLQKGIYKRFMNEEIECFPLKCCSKF